MMKGTKGLSNIGVINPHYWKVLDFCVRKNYNISQAVESISPNQLECKSWLVDELQNLPVEFKKVQLFGGWNGYPLIDMLLRNFNIESILNIDMNEEVQDICFRYRTLFGHEKIVKTKAHDILTMEGSYLDVDLVINTSAEHMPDLPILLENKQYAGTCIFAIQSNNMFYLDEHVNCVNSVDELEKKSNFKHIFYKGTKVLNNYERYMVIGIV